MAFSIKEESGFKYLEEGQGEAILLLHGLFGALSNWEGVVKEFSKNYKVLIPVMPIHEMPIKSASVDGLVTFIEEFVKFKSLSNLTLLGNSLGGHVGLIFTLRNQENVNKLVLTGSSGLFENSMGGSFPKRGSYEYVREKVAYTFYDPKAATTGLVDEVFAITKDIPKCIRIVALAKSAQRHNMAKDITNITIPTLLIWGLNDAITPPIVGHEFNKLIPGSILRFIDKCGHAPMMELPQKFNSIVAKFMQV